MDGKTLRKYFGRRVKRLRVLKGYTQESLAEETQISVEYLSRIERGISSPSFNTIALLSKALGVEPQDLFDFSQYDTSSDA